MTHIMDQVQPEDSNSRRKKRYDKNDRRKKFKFCGFDGNAALGFWSCGRVYVRFAWIWDASV